MNNERYLRHSLIDWFSQGEIKKKHIAVIGAGAVGNEVVKNLVLLGVGNIDIYDFDTIEIHNLTRSVLFRAADIGKSKSDVSRMRAKELDDSLNINSYTGNVWDTLSVERLRKYNCVISCVDNFETRIKLNQLCLFYNVDFINTGIDSRFVSIEVFPFGVSRATACYECNLPHSVYGRISQRYSCGWLKKISFIEKKIPTTIVTSSMAGAIAVSCALRLGGESNGNASYKILVDTISNAMSKTVYDRNDSCIICSIPSEKVYFSSDGILSSDFVDSSVDKEISIRTSDQIIVSAVCKNCDSGKNNVIFDRASSYDDSIMVCKECGMKAVEIEIRDQFSHAELIQQYYGKKMPAKYIYSIIGNIILIVNMKGGQNE